MKEENNIFGLAYCCPAQNREANCPFKDLDHLSFKEKVSFINELSKEDKQAIWEHHQFCPKNR